VKILGVSWVGILSDGEVLAQYLERTLGLPLRSRGQSWHEFAAGAAMVEILTSSSNASRYLSRGVPAVAFEVESLDDAIDELRTRGGTLRGGVEAWRGGGERHRWVYLDAPEGVVLLLRETGRDQG
jgi:hypothetical protein